MNTVRSGTRAYRRVGSGIAALLLLSAAAGRVDAQERSDAPLLYNVSATGVGVGLVYDREGLIALSPLLDIGFPRSTAGADSTPSASARAAAADPGLLSAGNAIAPVLGVPPGFVPPYPLFADAGFPSGPATAEAGVRQDVPVRDESFFKSASGRATAEKDSATAQARFARVDNESPQSASARRLLAGEAGRTQLADLVRAASSGLRAAGVPVADTDSDGTLVEFAAGESRAAVKREGTQVTSSAEGRMLGVRLLGGLFTISEIRGGLDLTWKNPGEKPAVERTALVSGAEFLGVPVAFTDNGFEFQGNSVPVPVEAAINQMVAQRGGVFRLGDSQVAGSRADVAALAFDFDGQLQPEIPGVLSAERDIAHLTLGAAATTFFSELGAPASAVQDDTGLAGADGSVVPGASPANTRADTRDGSSLPDDAGSPSAPLEGSFPAALSGSADPGDYLNRLDQIGTSATGGSESLGLGRSPAFGEGPGALGGGSFAPSSPSDRLLAAPASRFGEIADPDAAARLRWITGLLALGGLLCLVAMAARPLARVLPARNEDALD